MSKAFSLRNNKAVKAHATIRAITQLGAFPVVCLTAHVVNRLRRALATRACPRNARCSLTSYSVRFSALLLIFSIFKVFLGVEPNLGMGYICRIAPGVEMRCGS